MSRISRRQVLGGSLAGIGWLASRSGMTLADEAEPTAATADLHGYLEFLREGSPQHGAAVQSDAPVTLPQILGPYHRENAPFRGKVTPPFEPGRVLIVRGRVYGADTKEPLAGVVLDVWQANAEGHYDMSHPDYPLEEGIFLYRTRVVTDETGYYEYETIYPGRYATSPGRYRPAHIHYWVRHAGYAELITQLYFTGDPWNGKERDFQESLVRPLKQHQRGKNEFESCDFDIVLARANA
jgi:protocatechuate 3,4-dioxygenase beta subunit